MKRLTFLVVILAIFCVTGQAAFAQTFSIQGVLRDPLGRTVEDDVYSLTFRIYVGEIGGSALWTETLGSVEVKHGVFAVELGTVTSMSELTFDTQYYIGISVEDDQELEPRIKMTNAPSAYGVYGVNNTFPSTGNVGVGTAEPQAGLHIKTHAAADNLLKIESSGTGGNIMVNADGKMIVTQDSLISDALEIHGNLNIRDGHVIKFSDGTSLASADYGGSATGVTSPGDAIITADADNVFTGDIQFNIGATTVATIGNDGNIAATGDLSAANVSTGTVTATGDLSAANVSTGTVTATGDLTSANVSTGTVTATGDLSAANVSTGTVTATGDLSAANVSTGTVTATGDLSAANVTASENVIVGGNVGIGTTEPGAKLHIAGGVKIDSTNTLEFGAGIAGKEQNSGMIGYQTFTADALDIVGAGTDVTGTRKIRFWNEGGAVFGGNVGINVDPPLFPLHVGGWGNYSVGGYGYLNAWGQVGAHGASTIPVGIWSAQRIVCGEFNAVSDVRIKNVIGVSNGSEDLETLNKLEVTDYTYFDKIAKGNSPHKKLIAQQTREVYPEAVSLDTDFIPSVYEKSESVSYDKAEGTISISTVKPHGFVSGDKVRIIHKTGMVELDVVEIKYAHTFTVNSDQAYDEVFVFGKRVDDFHSIDYDAISMLNVSATQELARRVEQLEKENETLRAQIAKFSSAMDRLEALVTAQQGTNEDEKFGAKTKDTDELITENDNIVKNSK
ncbi:tail fiber domain-containing protein [bacterium]|nr:tail fiber domain-containing protein [bacterium]MBU1634481.1 tail fiber domain-containing protein [bacterium]MBU1874641.1 tail fiber domain-containing protein [bacterium]